MFNNLADLNFSAQILAKEAVRRGYKLTFLAKTSSDTLSPIILAQKTGRQIIFKSSKTGLDSAFSGILSDDKITTYDLLSRHNLPIPPTFILRRDEISEDLSCKTSSDFSQVFRESSPRIVELSDFFRENFPVVVKPSNTDHGNGVTIAISDKKTLREAIFYACENSINADILIQKQVTGEEFRFIVLNGKTIFVANRVPPFVIGDGAKTLRELIEIKNTDPRRGEKYDSPLTKINLDEVAHFLGREKLDEIPQQNEKIELLKTSNLSRGGEPINCTQKVSRELCEIAEKAARLCGIGLAGVDIMTKNISSSKGFIIEVNDSPGLRVATGEIDIAKIIFDELEKITIKI